MTQKLHEDLVNRLHTRAQIRRNISTRKSVQEGKPDRIADLLEEAAYVIEELRVAYHPKYDTYFYPSTGEWVEPKCCDPNCEYCVPRPSNAYD